MADLKNFDDRYEDEKTKNECNMRTKLQKQFLENLTSTTQKFKRYMNHLDRNDETMDEALRAKYSETMEKTRQASALLDREIKQRLIIEIDKLSPPENQATVERTLNTSGTISRSLPKPPKANI